MIPIEKLRELKRAYVHSSCPDGVASALILKDALPDLEVHFVKYNTKEHREIAPEPNTIFCDFSPWLPKETVSTHETIREELIRQWNEVGVIVLDHHDRAIVEPYPFGVFGENDKLECGAMLAYREVWMPLHDTKIWDPDISPSPNKPYDDMQRFARLAAIRDTWKKDDPDWGLACEQAAELMFWKFDQISIDPIRSGSIGARLLEKQIELAETCIKEAFIFGSNKGTRVLMFQGVSATSDAAEILERNFKKATKPLMGLIANRAFPPPNPDLVVGFHYRSDGGTLKLQFSTRSHTGFDCQVFAQAHGGNGHKAAAGFTICVHEGNAVTGMNPTAVFQWLLNEYEAKL